MPSSAHIFETVLFFLRRERKERFQSSKKRKRAFETGSANRAAIASEEGCSVPLPPERRKLHIHSLLLPSQIATVSLCHILVLEGFAAPHAILMMAVRRLLADTACRSIRSCKHDGKRIAKRPSADGRFFTFLFFLRGHGPASPRRRTRAGCPPGCHRPGASRAAPWAAAAARDTSPWPRPRCPGSWP